MTKHEKWVGTATDLLKALNLDTSETIKNQKVWPKTANALGIGSVTVASAQSIGGSLGSAIAPAKVVSEPAAMALPRSAVIPVSVITSAIMTIVPMPTVAETLCA